MYTSLKRFEAVMEHLPENWLLPVGVVRQQTLERLWDVPGLFLNTRAIEAWSDRQ